MLLVGIGMLKNDSGGDHGPHRSAPFKPHATRGLDCDCDCRGLVTPCCFLLLFPIFKGNACPTIVFWEQNLFSSFMVHRWRGILLQDGPRNPPCLIGWDSGLWRDTVGDPGFCRCWWGAIHLTNEAMRISDTTSQPPEPANPLPDVAKRRISKYD